MWCCCVSECWRSLCSTSLCVIFGNRNKNRVHQRRVVPRNLFRCVSIPKIELDPKGGPGALLSSHFTATARIRRGVTECEPQMLLPVIQSFVFSDTFLGIRRANESRASPESRPTIFSKFQTRD